MFVAMGHRSRKLLIRGLLFFVSALPVLPGYAQAPDARQDNNGQLRLAAAVEIALMQNPGLAAFDALSDALATRPSQAGALPDPVLSLNALNLPTNSFALGQEQMTQLQVGLSQQFPFPGKRKLMRATAEYEASAGEARVTEQRDALRGAVRSAWWQLFYVERALDTVSKNQRLMRDFVELAETKYAVGDGLQQDVLLAQLELSRLLDLELGLSGQRRTAQAELNALLNRPPDQLVTLADTPPNESLPELPPEQDLLDSAVESRASLEVQHDLLEAAEQRLALAKRDVYPDFRLGAGYGFRQGDDPLRGGPRSDLFSVMFSVNIPLYFGSKQSKAIDQRGSELIQQSHLLTDTLRSIESQITRHLADYEAAQQQVSLLNTAIIPQARQTVASMLAGYQVDQVDFLNVINGQLTLYNAELNYWQALRNAKQALAGVAAATGRETLYE